MFKLTIALTIVLLPLSAGAFSVPENCFNSAPVCAVSKKTYQDSHKVAETSLYGKINKAKYPITRKCGHTFFQFSKLANTSYSY
ncbi:MAG: hypothetical protein HOE90_03780 [Bacteriovoracaceae bacterium]|nr:hypothetical protein [Bacteriovoracaceae bacterium]